jgi:WD40 repeat protein
MAQIDLRMGKLLDTKTLHSDEITSVTLNSSGSSLAAGTKDGYVKIFDL